MRIKTWIGIAVAVLCAAGMMVIMPEYTSKRVDAGMLDTVSTYEQQQTETMNQGLSVVEKIEILTQGFAEGNQTSVISREGADNLDDIDEQLLPQLKQQITQLEEMKLIPDMGGMNLEEWQYDSVVLSAYTSSQFLGKVLYVWDISVVIPNYASLYVSLDASTYTIYRYMYQDTSDREGVLSCMDEFLACRGKDGMESYMQEWMQDYMEYLGEKTAAADWKIHAYSDKDDYNAEDVKQATSVIVSNTGEPYFATHLYVDYASRCFQFVPDMETVSYMNEYDKDGEEISISVKP